MTSPIQKRKLYCFVDESGQDTLGELFIVAVVIAQAEFAALEDELERIEKLSGKNRMKWHDAKPARRLEYIRQVITLPALSGKLTYNLFHHTKDYWQHTAEAIAQSLATQAEYDTVTVLIDALPKAKVTWFGFELRRRGIKVRKIRGIRKEDASAMMRLADALCGFVRAAKSGRSEFDKLLQWALQEGIVKEL